MMMQPGQHPRLLLIDDHVDLAEATADFLSKSGMEVRIAQSGAEATAMTEVFRPDIVLCDLNLPDTSGFDLARRLRANPNTKGVVFVVHTAMAETDIRTVESGVRAGEIDLFLSKPLTDRKVDQLLALYSSRRASS